MDYEAGLLCIETLLAGLKEISEAKKDTLEIIKQHDDWKYSLHSTIGPVDNRHEIKVRGDNKEEVLADYEAIKKALMRQ